MENAITYLDLSLSFGAIISIENIEITESPNRHSMLELIVVLEVEREQRIFNEVPEIITLYYKKDSEKKILFSGVKIKAEMIRTERYIRLSLTAKSLTYFMDVEKKIHSFQNTADKPDQIIEYITRKYPGCIGLEELENCSIGQFLLQYEETDWEFLKRLANKHSAMLYPNVMSEKIQFRAGLSRRTESYVLNENFYVVQKNYLDYEMGKIGRKSDVFSQEYINYQVESFDIIPIGVKLIFKQYEWYVKKVSRRLKNGLLVSTYDLAQREEEIKPRYFNNLLTGISLPGRVRAVKRDQVQVDILNDNNNISQGQYWFPFSTVAGSSDGSGWYCMPEKMEPIRVYFPTSDESDAYVISCMAGNNKHNKGKMDPNVRNISTAQGNVVTFTDTGVAITVKGGTESINLNKSGEIIINAADSIAFYAGEKILLEAETISFEAKEKLEITDDSGITIVIEQSQMDIEAIKIDQN